MQVTRGIVVSPIRATLKAFEEWFSLPEGISEAEQQTRDFRIVAVILIVVVTALLGAVALIQPSVAGRAIAAILVIDAAGLAGLWMSARGWTRAASVLLLATLMASVSRMAIDAGGIRSPGMATFLLFTLLAALLLGRRAATVTAAAAALIAISLTVLELIGRLPPQTVIYEPGALLFLNLTYIAVMLVVVDLIVRSISRSLTRAQRELAERQRVDSEREGLVVELRERVKEIRLLHQAARLLEPERAFGQTLLDDLVRIIPPAWMHSDCCEARIQYRDMEARTGGWRETAWKQAASFQSSEGAGNIEVVYTGERPARAEGPFLLEERTLINSLAEMLQSFIERDVANRNRQVMEASLRQAQKMDALGTLAGGIAHDFNNILTAIGGNAEMGLADSKDPETREFFSEIRAAAGRARDLVKRILIFSRRQESTQAVVRLEPVVKEAAQLLKASLPPRIDIRTRFAAEARAVKADASQVHQVVMNLGTNAAYAMRSAPGVLEIELGLAVVGGSEAVRLDLPAGEYMRLIVRDSGTGMTSEVRERLFEPFFTTKGLEGTGLGLSVVHGIVRDHRGAIDVASELGVGTTIAVYLPAVSAEGRPEVEPEPVRGGGQRVMYVDDDPRIVVLMSRVLKRLGYEPDCYSNPQRALEAFIAAPFACSVVITDMAMPGLTGVELAAAIHAVRPGVPVVLSSGYGADDPEFIRTYNIAAVLHKPASLSEISRVLGDIISHTDRPTGGR